MSESFDTQATIYQLAGLGGSHPAEQLRAGICAEAIADEDWRTMYDERLAEGGVDPENSTTPGRAPAVPDDADFARAANTMSMLRAFEAANTPAGVTSGTPQTRRRQGTSLTVAPLETKVSPTALSAIVGALIGSIWGLATRSFPVADGGVGGYLQGLLIDDSATMAVIVGACVGASLLTLPLNAIRSLTAVRRVQFAVALGSVLICVGRSAALLLIAMLISYASGPLFAGIERRRATRATKRASDSGAAVPVFPFVDETLYGTSANPAQAVAVLRAHASRLGAKCQHVDAVDAVSAMIGADAWMFALSARWFEQAASFGPASVGALAAILSRAAGTAVTTLPDLGGLQADDTSFPGLKASIAKWTAWAERSGDAAGVLDRVAADLQWGGGGDDRLSRLGRTLRAAI